MQKYIDVITNFHESNPVEFEFIIRILPKFLANNPENQTEIEEILDYLYSKPKLDISKIGYSTLVEKKDKRHKKIQEISSKDNEVEGIDYEVVLDFDDGLRFVKLISQECYAREGKLMSHCVASYYGRETEVYSLRDKKNLPHCTVEKNQQIKGKGNGKIDPKYIDYVIKFLEFLGMTIGENEMKNLGYYKLDSIDSDLSCDKMYNGYVYQDNIGEIKDKDGDTYQGFGLLDIKSLFDFDVDLNFSLNFNISSIISYFSEKISKIKKNNNSGDYAKVSNSGDYAQVANSGDYAKVSNSGDNAQVANSGYNAQVANSGNYARVASSGDYAQVNSKGENSVVASIGKGDIVKANIGTWITLAEYDKELKPILVKTFMIDGKKYKEDTRYKLENKKITEYILND